jgi:hypothetical protein
MASHHDAIAVALHATVPRTGEMRYLWVTPIHRGNERLKDVLGPEPHTPLDVAVRETLIGIGCMPKAPLRQTIGSASLAVSAL